MQIYHNQEYTPEIISSLKDNEVFVFGSNVEGRHKGGAAKIASEKFGAIYGQAFGIQGQSYAIPTIDLRMGLRSIPLYIIEWHVDDLFRCATRNPDMKFYVTKIGTNLAGYTIEEIASIFKDKVIPRNVVLPIEFVESPVVITNNNGIQL